MTEQIERTARKTLQGVVVSDKMDKTRVIKVERKIKHPLYGKILKRSKKFYAHDEKNESHANDIVEIMSTRPLSKQKRWRLVRIVNKAQM